MTTRINGRALLFALLLASGISMAGGIDAYQFKSPEHEQRYKTLIAELRCLVCQNQNIQDSNAELAQDLRRKTRELLEQNMTDDEIRDFMVQRYGDFVLYSPPVRTRTLLLWVGPFVILAIGLAIMTVTIRRRRARDESAELKSEQLREAHSLLDSNKGDDRT